MLKVTPLQKGKRRFDSSLFARPPPLATLAMSTLSPLRLGGALTVGLLAAVVSCMATLAVLVVMSLPVGVLLPLVGALLLWGWGPRATALLGVAGLLWLVMPEPLQDLELAYGGVNAVLTVILMGMGATCFPYMVYGMLSQAALVQTVMDRRGRPVLGLVITVPRSEGVALPIFLLGIVFSLLDPDAWGRVGRVGPLGNTLEVHRHGLLVAIVLLIRDLVVLPNFLDLPCLFELSFKELARSVGVRERLPHAGDAVYRKGLLAKSPAHMAAFQLGRQLMRVDWSSKG